MSHAHADLNPEQRLAVEHGDGPLLIIAGAGTGKTRTLVHRVARVIEQGGDPRRMLLLTFTRRAAGEMLRRVDSLLGRLPRSRGRGTRPLAAGVWGGTFHAVAARLLRGYGNRIGLDPNFTIHDRGDAEDLLDVVRTELELAKSARRFPKKGTCLAIYSLCVNTERPLADVLDEQFPWCRDNEQPLKELFQGYVDRKEACAVLDYDDLLLFWRGLLEDQRAGERVRGLFDHVFVDEYQDTNRLQAAILRALRPDGQGLTVVGDDAQAIYSFRGASVRNILDFPREFPGTAVVTLERNYRSTVPVLEVANHVIAQASERFTKDLWTDRPGGERPQLVMCGDEVEQAEFVAGQILKHREADVPLKEQAVLFRASHHSILLEAELARRGIPFVKYGGLKFLETAHVKDLLSFLRLAENPRDVMAGTRVLQLLPGIGPRKARQLTDALVAAGGRFAAWRSLRVPGKATESWQGLLDLLDRLSRCGEGEVAAQVHAVRVFYEPLLEERHDHAPARKRDLEQVEQLARRFADRKTLLAEIALDPPATTEEYAGEPHLDEESLVLSTIHSAKGLEWDTVFVIHAADGNIPSDMALRSVEQTQEELRLFYVALTRARNRLSVCWPLRYYHAARGPLSDRYGFALLTRFIPEELKPRFEQRTPVTAEEDDQLVPAARTVRQRARAMWS